MNLAKIKENLTDIIHHPVGMLAGISLLVGTAALSGAALGKAGKESENETLKKFMAVPEQVDSTSTGLGPYYYYRQFMARPQ